MARSPVEALERHGILLVLLLAVVLIAFVVFSILTFVLVALTSAVVGIVRTFKKTYRHRR